MKQGQMRLSGERKTEKADDNHLFFYYVGNIACDISGITRKSTAENPIGVADFLIAKRGEKRNERYQK